MITEAIPYEPSALRALSALVKEGEGQRLEFKLKANHPDKIVRELVAFANTDGGILLVGVDDNGTMTGTRYPDEDLHVIEQELLRTARPRLDFTHRIVRLTEKKFLLEIAVPRSEKRPHEVRSGSVADSYVRVKDQSVRCSAEMREIIRRRRLGKNVSFQYGDTEHLLMQHLATHGSTSVQDLRRLARLSRFQASRKLILLTLSGVLRIVPSDKGDTYVRA